MNPITATLVREAVPGPGEVLRSENTPSSCPLRGKIMNIGRGAQNDIVLESLQISRRHAELKNENGKWFIRDVSTNGISINSRRLAQQQFFPLQHQDLLQFIPTPGGHLVYRFLYNNSDDEVVVDEDDNESLLSVKSPAEPVIIDEKKGQKRKLHWHSTPTSQKRRPELIQLSDDEEYNAQIENDKPLESLTQTELIEEVKLLRGRLARAKELNKKHVDGLKIEKRRLEDELQTTRDQVEEFGGRVNGLLESELCCSVCSEVFVDARVTTCGHTFCSYCIREWLRKKGDCPICRKTVRGSSRHVEIDNFVEKTHLLLSADTQSRRAAFIAERKLQEQQPAIAPRIVDFMGQMHALLMNGAGPTHRRGGRRSHRGSRMAAAAAAAASTSAQNLVQVQPGVIDLSLNQ